MKKVFDIYLPFIVFGFCVCMVFLVPLAMAQDVEDEIPTAVIQLQAVTEQDLTDNGITTGRATGLPVVGYGTTVYLLGSGIPVEETEIIGYQWTITGDDFLFDSTEQNPTFVPAVVGTYKVELVVTDSAGEKSKPASLDITAAKWLGVANCAICHSDTPLKLGNRFEEWSMTGHAAFFAENIDHGAAYYGERCIHCHTVGYDELVDNGGFDDVARKLGWTYPETKEAGNWAKMQMDYPDLANLANIQCENCHGPGGSHYGNRFKIATTFDSGMCGFCHDARGGGNHVKNYQWDTSNHASFPPIRSGPGSESCVPCHTGIGFVMTHDEDYATHKLSTEPSAIGCAVCHDPHNEDNEHQVRVVKDVTLGNGVVVTAEEAGLGALCINCHKARTNVDEYALEYHSRFGPHHGPQGDLVKGTGGYEYPDITYTSFSPHMKVTGDSCVTCHMAEPPEDAPDRAVGLHTFRMSAAAGEIEGVTEDVVNTNACARCHGEMESINYMAKGDYDGDNVREGIQDEVSGLMELVGHLLPPYGSPDVAVADTYTDAELKAAYNHIFLEEDRSQGVHNPQYAVQLLQSSYFSMTGQNIPNAYMLIEWTTPVDNWSIY